MPEPLDPPPKRAPTLYAIIVIKLAKGLLLVTAAIMAYTLSDNDLPLEFKSLLHTIGLDPQRRFFVGFAKLIASWTESHMLWFAAGLVVYSLFSLVEGVGLIFRATWAGWLAICEGAFFIPIEIYEIQEKGISPGLVSILVLNIIIVIYLVRNRHRLFKHHHHHAPEPVQVDVGRL